MEFSEFVRDITTIADVEHIVRHRSEQHVFHCQLVGDGDNGLVTSFSYKRFTSTDRSMYIGEMTIDRHTNSINDFECHEQRMGERLDPVSRDFVLQPFFVGY
jgi:hypothetical protein